MHPGAQKRQERRVNEFRQMHKGRTPRVDKAHEGVFLKFGQFQSQFLGKSRPVTDIPCVQRGEDMAAYPCGHLPPFLHQLLHGLFVQKGQKGLVIAEAARRPDETDEAPPERRAEFQPDTDGKPHDRCGLQQLARGRRLHIIVINHRKIADALDPGVHHQVRGVFSPFRVGVMDMVIHGQLVPFLGHFKEVMTPEKKAHKARIARGRAAEIPHEPELGVLVAAGADDFLHDLDQHAPRVVAERRAGAVQDLVAQRAEGHKAVLDLARSQIAEQVDDGVRDAEFMRGGEFQDAVRVEIGVENLVLHVGRGAMLNGFIDHVKELVVLPVEKKTVWHRGQS